MTAPVGRLIGAAAMVGYDAALHLIAIFVPTPVCGRPSWWTAHDVYLWLRFQDDGSYNTFWAGWHGFAGALALSAAWRIMRDKRGY